MYQCFNCGQWVSQGCSHYCNQLVGYQPMPLTESLQPVLERIAKALETLIEQNKKGV